MMHGCSAQFNHPASPSSQYCDTAFCHRSISHRHLSIPVQVY
jgi:hypothetical protein